MKTATTTTMALTTRIPRRVALHFPFEFNIKQNPKSYEAPAGAVESL
jgi:hypothetical protein